MNLLHQTQGRCDDHFPLTDWPPLSERLGPWNFTSSNKALAQKSPLRLWLLGNPSGSPGKAQLPAGLWPEGRMPSCRTLARRHPGESHLVAGLGNLRAASLG